MPAQAAPTAAPTKPDSEMGVVQHAARMLVEQALGHAQHAAPGVLLAGRAGAARVVLAHHDHARVAGHFLVQRLVDGLLVGDLSCHGNISSVFSLGTGQ